MSVERIVALAGLVNGSNRSFTAPNKFEAGTLRVVWNGQVYESGDTRKGWTETTDQVIETTVAPRVGDVLQAFYQQKSTGEQIGVEGVVGSPFHPLGLLP